MTGRFNPFTESGHAPTFAVKERSPMRSEPSLIDELANDHSFPSRQASKNRSQTEKNSQRRARIHRTGRNQQLNIKATRGTIERFYAAADRRQLTLCALLEHALDALEAEGK